MCVVCILLSSWAGLVTRWRMVRKTVLRVLLIVTSARCESSVIFAVVPQPFAREHLLLRTLATCVFNCSDATPESHCPPSESIRAVYTFPSNPRKFEDTFITPFSSIASAKDSLTHKTAAERCAGVALVPTTSSSLRERRGTAGSTQCVRLQTLWHKLPVCAHCVLPAKR
jgi:hypothetical protein